MKFIWVLIVAGMVAIAALQECHSEPLVWNTPAGTIGLPFNSTEAVMGFDAVLKESIAGVSIPIYIAPNGLVDLQLGAVAAWPTNGATFEPYLALAHNVLKEIPALSNFKSMELNVFGRYASEQGKAGVGLAFSYAFVGPEAVAPTVRRP